MKTKRWISTGTIILLFTVLIPTLFAMDVDQAINLVEQRLLPGGKDEVVLKIWGPIPAGTEIRSTRELVMRAPMDGYAVYIDDYPTANLFHPVRYAFVASAGGEVQAAAAMSPPLNEPEYTRISTAIGDLLMAATNVYPVPAAAPVIPPLPPTRGVRWAVLMNGGYNASNNHVRYWNDLSNIYTALDSVYGFADENIIVLCSDGLDPAPDQSNGQNSNPDLDNDGDPDIMYSCVLSNVDMVFNWLAQNLSSDDQLFIFTTDHGESAGGWNTNQNLWNQEILTDAHFAQLISALPQGLTIAFTLEPCYSGGFLDNLIVPPGPIVGSSACAYNELSWAMPPNYLYDTYVFHWTAAVKGIDAFGVAVDADYNHDGIVTMDEAYRYALEHDTSNEHPQYGEQPAGLGATVSLWPMAAPLAPAAPTNFTVNHNQAQLLASLAWTNPTLTFNGQPLTSISSVVVKRNGAVVATLNGSPGQAMTYNDPVPSAASYSYQVYAVNEAGNGVSANITAWIGLDTPGPVTSLTGSGVGTTLAATISWVNPTVGQHAGYFTTNSITGYIIHRYGPSTATFNLSGLQASYADNNIPMQGWYHYGVIAQDASGNGPETMTPNFYVGPPEMAAIPFNWVEINGIGTNTGLTGDDQNLGPFPIGFGYNHYGTTFTSIRVCSNGWASFTSTSTAYSNASIPNTAEPNNLVAPLWDDLYPPGGGVIYYYYDQANSRFIIEWDNVMSYVSPRTPQKFEVILYPNGDMDFMYHTIQAPCVNANTAGKENGTGTVGVLATYNGSGPLEPASNTGIRIYGAPPTIPNVTITLTPINPPIQIPASGGSFDFNANLANGESTAQTFAVWIMTRLPNQSWYGPVLGPLNLTLPGQGSLTRMRTQSVPASAPAGSYTYEGRVGSYPTTVWDTGSFPFTKLSMGDGVPVTGWENTGESFDPIPTAASAPQTYALYGAYPNPFNPTTRIRYDLPEAVRVSLKVYDIRGRLTATLADGLQDAGLHEAGFDASSLPSGVYVVRLEAGNFTAASKIVLMK